MVSDVSIIAEQLKHWWPSGKATSANFFAAHHKQAMASLGISAQEMLVLGQHGISVADLPLNERRVFSKVKISPLASSPRSFLSKRALKLTLGERV